MSGQVTFQLSGTIEERSLESFEVTNDDIKTVMDQAGCDEAKAKEALETAKGDIAEAIIALSE